MLVVPNDATLKLMAVIFPATMPAALNSAAVNKYCILASVDTLERYGVCAAAVLPEDVPTTLLEEDVAIFLASSTTELPEHDALGVATTLEMFGKGFTVTVIVLVVAQPLNVPVPEASVAVTV